MTYLFLNAFEATVVPAVIRGIEGSVRDKLSGIVSKEGFSSVFSF